MLSIFSCAFQPSVRLLWRSVYLNLLPMLWLGCSFVCLLFILSCISCLYIWEINLLSIASFANIFSHSEGCLFILFMVSFAVQKLLSLIRPYLLIFAFIFITLGGESKKIFLGFMSESVLLRASQVVLVVKNPPAIQETGEMQVRSLCQEDPLEKSMPIHFSILVWRVPWTEEPGGLQSSHKELDMTEHERMCSAYVFL